MRALALPRRIHCQPDHGLSLIYLSIFNFRQTDGYCLTTCHGKIVFWKEEISVQDPAAATEPTFRTPEYVAALVSSSSFK